MTPFDRHHIFWVSCASCDKEARAVKRDGRIEPPDGWASITPDCCGVREERFVCEDKGCPPVVLRWLFDGHPEAARLLAVLFGPLGRRASASRLYYVREGNRIRLERA